MSVSIISSIKDHYQTTQEKEYHWITYHAYDFTPARWNTGLYQPDKQLDLAVRSINELTK